MGGNRKHNKHGGKLVSYQEEVPQKCVRDKQHLMGSEDTQAVKHLMSAGDDDVRKWLQEIDAPNTPTECFTLLKGSQTAKPQTKRPKIVCDPDTQNSSQSTSLGRGILATPERRPIADVRLTNNTQEVRKQCKRKLVSSGISVASSRPRAPIQRETFERRKRHKTREDRYDIHDLTKQTRRRATDNEETSTSKTKDIPRRNKHRKVSNKARRRAIRKVGADLMRSFSSKHIASERLTMRSPNDRLGLFKNGRVSSLLNRGIPNLAFSEMKFLTRPKASLEMREEIVSSTPWENGTKRAQTAQDEITDYFMRQAMPSTEIGYPRQPSLVSDRSHRHTVSKVADLRNNSISVPAEDSEVLLSSDDMGSTHSSPFGRNPTSIEFSGNMQCLPPDRPSGSSISHKNLRSVQSKDAEDDVNRETQSRKRKHDSTPGSIRRSLEETGIYRYTGISKDIHERFKRLKHCSPPPQTPKISQKDRQEERRKDQSPTSGIHCERSLERCVSRQRNVAELNGDAISSQLHNQISAKDLPSSPASYGMAKRVPIQNSTSMDHGRTHDQTPDKRLRATIAQSARVKKPILTKAGSKITAKTAALANHETHGGAVHQSGENPNSIINLEAHEDAILLNRFKNVAIKESTTSFSEKSSVISPRMLRNAWGVSESAMCNPVSQENTIFSQTIHNDYRHSKFDGLSPPVNHAVDSVNKVDFKLPTRGFSTYLGTESESVQPPARHSSFGTAISLYPKERVDPLSHCLQHYRLPRINIFGANTAANVPNEVAVTRRQPARNEISSDSSPMFRSDVGFSWPGLYQKHPVAFPYGTSQIDANSQMLSSGPSHSALERWDHSDLCDLFPIWDGQHEGLAATASDTYGFVLEEQSEEMGPQGTEREQVSGSIMEQEDMAEFWGRHQGY